MAHIMSERRLLSLLASLFIVFVYLDSTSDNSLIESIIGSDGDVISKAWSTDSNGEQLFKARPFDVLDLWRANGTSPSPSVTAPSPIIFASPSPSSGQDTVFTGSQTVSADISVYTGTTSFSTVGTTTYSGTIVDFQGVVSVTAARVFDGTTRVTFSGTSQSQFFAAVSFIGTGLVTFASGSAVEVRDTLSFASTGGTTLTGSTFALSLGTSIAYFRSIVTSINDATFSGLGSANLDKAGSTVTCSGGSWAVPMQIEPVSTAVRAQTFPTGALVKWCGGVFGDVVVGANSGLQIDTSCTSATVNSLQVQSDGWIIFTAVSATSKVTTVSTSATLSGTMEIILADGSDQTDWAAWVDLLKINTATSEEECTRWGDTDYYRVDNCPTDKDCLVQAVHQRSGTSTCIVSFKQESGGSNSSLWWLLLLLLIPLCCLCVLLFMCCKKKKAKKAKKDEPLVAAVAHHDDIHIVDKPDPTMDYDSGYRAPVATPVASVATPEPMMDTSHLRPWFGVGVKWLDDGKGGRDNVCCVHEVYSGSPAEYAGIQKDDVLELWDDELIDSEAMWKSKVKFIGIGDHIKLSVRRDHMERKLTVEIKGTDKAKSETKTVTSVNVVE